MNASPVKRFFAILAWSIGLLSTLIGVVFLLSGLQAYLGSGPNEVLPFAQMLLAVGFLSLPIGALLLHRARSSYIHGLEKYSLPDPPVRSMSMSLLGAACVLASVSAFLIASILF